MANNSKAPTLNLSYVTEKFFPDTPPAAINDGKCFLWAFAGYMENLEDKRYDVKLCTLPDSSKHGNHAFLKMNNTFYDAEAHLGVAAWRYLPFVRLYENTRKVHIKNHEVIVHESVGHFTDYWGFDPGNDLREFADKHFPDFALLLPTDNMN